MHNVAEQAFPSRGWFWYVIAAIIFVIFEAVIFVGISNVKREFIIDYGAEVHGAMGEEGMRVERIADAVGMSASSD